jgi:hypothetical protein
LFWLSYACGNFGERFLEHLALKFELTNAAVSRLALISLDALAGVLPEKSVDEGTGQRISTALA